MPLSKNQVYTFRKGQIIIATILKESETTYSLSAVIDGEEKRMFRLRKECSGNKKRIRELFKEELKGGF